MFAAVRNLASFNSSLVPYGRFSISSVSVHTKLGFSEYFWPQFEECAKSVRSSFPDTLTGYSVPRAVSGLNLCLVVQKIGVTGKLPLYFASGFFFQKNLFFCASASETQWCLRVGRHSRSFQLDLV